MFVHVADLERVCTFHVDGLGLDLTDDAAGLRLGSNVDFHIGLEVVPGLARRDEMEFVIPLRLTVREVQ